MVLSKQELKMGIKTTKIIKIPSLKNEEIEIRKLSNAEVAQIQELESEGLGTMETTQSGKRQQNGTQTIRINAVKQVKSSNKAKCTAVAYSLSLIGGEAWTPSEVNDDLDSNVVSEIYEEVLKFNKIRADIEGEVDEFPENT